MKKLLLGVMLLTVGMAYAQDHVVEKSKVVVAARMKDPGSALFLDVVHVLPHGALKDDLVCGRVNAKNSFGGYVGYRRFVSFGDTAIVEGEDSVMDDILKGAWGQCAEAKAGESEAPSMRSPSVAQPAPTRFRCSYADGKPYVTTTPSKGCVVE